MGSTYYYRCFNEAAGVDPADGVGCGTGCASGAWCFNEAAGVDPADGGRSQAIFFAWLVRFNEAAGVDPADGDYVERFIAARG